jgi:hypothetical protein
MPTESNRLESDNEPLVQSGKRETPRTDEKSSVDRPISQPVTERKPGEPGPQSSTGDGSASGTGESRN